MKHLIQRTTLVILAAVSVALSPLAMVPAEAVNLPEKSCQAAGSSSPLCESSGDQLPELIKNVVNLLLAVLGFIAVIMIIIGGIRYTTSNGDQGNLKAAKDTILYSVVGLVVAILAYAIVNFVLEFFSSGSAPAA